MKTPRDTTTMAAAMALASLLSGASIGLPARADGSRVVPSAQHQVTSLITAGSASFTLDVGGTLDGAITRREQGNELPWVEAFQPGVYVSMTNVGRETVETPWISVDGRGDWLTDADVVADAMLPGMSDRDRALSAWSFMRANLWRVDQAWHPQYFPLAVSLNSFGYGECVTAATQLGRLVEAGGGKASLIGYPGHYVTEAWWNGGLHMLDADRAAYVIRAPGGDPISAAELIADHDAGRRVHRLGAAAPDDPELDSLLTHQWDARWASSELGVPDPLDMNYSLRPGETLFRSWQNWGKYSSYGAGPSSHRIPPKRFANGYLEYRPDLTDTLFVAGADEMTGLAGFARDGLRPNLHPDATGAGFVSFCLKSPYVVVGATIELTYARPREGDRVSASVSRNGREWTEVWSATGTGTGTAEVNLDDWVDPHDRRPIWAAYFRVDVEAEDAFGSGPRPGLDSLVMTLDLQLAPNALPELRLGPNVVSYRDAHAGNRAVMVVWGWDESSDNNRPAAPEPLAPAPGAVDVSPRPFFSWAPGEDPDGDAIIDYQVQVSEREDFRWPVTPNFDRYLSRTAFHGTTRWRPPFEGLLPTGGQYWWRVRAMDADSAWSPWSEAVPFTAGGPAPPESLALDVRGRDIRLHWHQGAASPGAVRWLVYGANEQGFSCTPDHLLASVSDTTCLVATTFPTSPVQNRCFYRVVAVTEAGGEERVSAPSAAIELPHPFIASTPEAVAESGAPYRYIPRASAARRFDRAFQDDIMTWKSEQLPDWLEVMPSGELVGTPPPVSGLWPVRIRVDDGHGGESRQQFVLRSGPAGAFTESIPLLRGNNLVSWPILPGSTHPDTVLMPILDRLDRVVAWEDESRVYRPGMPDSSTLSVLDPQHAYWLVMLAPDTLHIGGLPVEPSVLPIALEAGWNLLPYLPFAPDSVAHALAGLGSNLRAVSGIGDSSRVCVFDPLLPDVSTLALLQPNRGYWIEVDEADTLRFPGDVVIPDPGRPGSKDPPPPADAVSRRGPSSLYWGAIYGEGIRLEGELAPAGLLVSIHDAQGLACGTTRLSAPGSFDFVPVWEDDPDTPADEGVSPGDPLMIFVGGLVLCSEPMVYEGLGQRLRATGELAPMTSTPFDAAFDAHGAPSVPRFTAASPAPAGGEVAFTISVPGEARDAVIDVYSPAGRRVASLALPPLHPGTHAIRWPGRSSSGRALAPGVYFATLTHDSARLTTKIVLVR